MIIQLEPLDIGLFCLLLGTYLNSSHGPLGKRSLSLRTNHSLMSSEDYNRSYRILLLAIVPYGVWQISCILVGGFSNPFMEVGHSIIKFILPLGIPFVILSMRDRRKQLMYAIFAILTATSVVHLFIQLLDIRSIMAIAYYSTHATIFEDRAAGIETATFVRAIPSCSTLMKCCVIFSFSSFVTNRFSKKISQLLLSVAAIQFLGLFITHTRSIIGSIIIGCLFVVVFLFQLRVATAGSKRRMALAFLVFVLIIFAYSLKNRESISYWGRRMDSLNADAQILSTTTSRGLDNIGHINAIKDRPLLGHGMGSYEEKYSVRPEAARDSHALLVVGAVGGIPAIVLAIYLQLALFYGSWKRCLANVESRQAMIPYLAILVMFFGCNLFGIDSTFHSSSFFQISIIWGLIAIQPGLPSSNKSVCHNMQKRNFLYNERNQ
ncbi:MAG: O-antigen ligase family protein [Planctomycetes bacterium]|nr:O-antigen ligase family protein [Planctomycetota bacterium]